MLSHGSFDRILGDLGNFDSRIDGLRGNERNLDEGGSAIVVQPTALVHGFLDPAPLTTFGAVDLQIFDDPRRLVGRRPTMEGFVTSYARQRQSREHLAGVMQYFVADHLTVLSALATDFAVCDRWFASYPVPSARISPLPITVRPLVSWITDSVSVRTRRSLAYTVGF